MSTYAETIRAYLSRNTRINYQERRDMVESVTLTQPRAITPISMMSRMVVNQDNQSIAEGSDTGLFNPLTGLSYTTGASIPAGGTTGQVLGKSSNLDYALSWMTQSGSGGSGFGSFVFTTSYFGRTAITNDVTGASGGAIAICDGVNIPGAAGDFVLFGPAIVNYLNLTSGDCSIQSLNVVVGITAGSVDATRFNGSLWRPFYTRTFHFGLGLSDETTYADATAGSITLTLPAPTISAISGRTYRFRIKRIDNSANTVTVIVDGGVILMDTYASMSLAPYQSLDFQSNGVKYFLH